MLQPQRAGQQLGYIAGFLDTLEIPSSSSALSAPSERSGRVLAEVRQLLRAFPTEDPQDAALQSAMAELQSKFKALLATLGAAPYAQPQGAPSMEF